MLTSIVILTIVFICLELTYSLPAACSFPDPAVGFTNDKYEGKWFEIGKIQTKGGAFFEKDCVCTELNILQTNETDTLGNYYADNDCRSVTVDGPWTNMTGLLYNENLEKPGRWLENFGYGDVNYTVIAIGDDYAVEYDCATSAGVTNYCVHVMSRSRTMDMDLFYGLMDDAQAQGLNPQDLPIQLTLHDGC